MFRQLAQVVRGWSDDGFIYFISIAFLIVFGGLLLATYLRYSHRLWMLAA